MKRYIIPIAGCMGLILLVYFVLYSYGFLGFRMVTETGTYHGNYGHGFYFTTIWRNGIRIYENMEPWTPETLDKVAVSCKQRADAFILEYEKHN